MKPTILAPALLLLLALTGCTPKDDRLERLTVGISKDSAMAVMGVQKAARIDPYLVGGKYIEVMYYNPAAAVDTVPDRKKSPLIAVDGVLIGWGWKSLDSLSGVTRIPVAPK
jgi:hypothetical protein